MGTIEADRLDPKTLPVLASDLTDAVAEAGVAPTLDARPDQAPVPGLRIGEMRLVAPRPTSAVVAPVCPAHAPHVQRAAVPASAACVPPCLNGQRRLRLLAAELVEGPGTNVDGGVLLHPHGADRHGDRI